jgi:hypothetical protein
VMDNVHRGYSVEPGRSLMRNVSMI